MCVTCTLYVTWTCTYHMHVMSHCVLCDPLFYKQSWNCRPFEISRVSVTSILPQFFLLEVTILPPMRKWLCLTSTWKQGQVRRRTAKPHLYQQSRNLRHDNFHHNNDAASLWLVPNNLALFNFFIKSPIHNGTTHTVSCIIISKTNSQNVVVMCHMMNRFQLSFSFGWDGVYCERE